MADFNTELSAPSGAGANTVAPVQEQYVNTTPMNVIGELGSIFAKGLETNRKDQAEASKNAVLKQYSEKLGKLHDASESNALPQNEIGARLRALHREFAGSHPEYIKDFEQTASFYSKRSAVGEVEQKLETDKKLREERISAAQKQGHLILPTMSEEEKDQVLDAYSAELRADNEFKRLSDRKNQDMAEGRFNAEVHAREEKETAVRLVSEVASAHIGSAQSYINTLSRDLKSGALTADEAAFKLQEKFTGVEAALQAAARANPDLASPWRSIFQDMHKLGVKMTDPKSMNDDYKEQIDLILNKGKLFALSDPRIAAAAATQQILPNNPSVALAVAPEGRRAFAMIADMPLGTKNFSVPQIVGNPEVESGHIRLLKEGIKGLMKGKYADKEKASIELTNNANHLLKQTSEMLDKGADARDLKGVAEFFASPEYAHLVTSGTIDKQAATAAQKTLQIRYNQVVSGSVMNRLDQPLRTVSARDGEKQVPLTEVVEIKFNGTGINFLPKTMKGANDGMLSQQVSAVKQLESSAQGINQLIRIGAHMEGTTNYAKYWQDNKHVLFPGYFMEGVDVGTVKNGFKFKGGDARLASNWERQATSDGTKSN